MSQHDLTIANQGFPAFRSDLNNALQALGSLQSGGTAPSPTFAHQLWMDTSTTPHTLKLRNADNDAWITVARVDQVTDTLNIPVAQGGTGAATLTANNVILGNGTSAVQFVAPGTNGNVLTSNGTTWTSAAGAAGYAGVRAQVFTANGTFTIPTGITQLKVTVVGGGGGGTTSSAGGCPPSSTLGTGGGAGGAAIKWLTGLTPGNTLSVTRGSGGAAGASGGTSSVASGTQTITTISATGGANGGSGGIGSNGDLNIGGGAGSGGYGTTGSGGSGGNSILGGGGAGSTSSGEAGRAYGGGGAGGGISGSSGSVGSGGANGVIIFEY